MFYFDWFILRHVVKVVVVVVFFFLVFLLIGRQIFHVGWFDIFRLDKAFYQISVIREHRNYLRFLWVDDVFKKSPSIVKLRLARVVFGVASLP